MQLVGDFSSILARWFGNVALVCYAANNEPYESTIFILTNATVGVFRLHEIKPKLKPHPSHCTVRRVVLYDENTPTEEREDGRMLIMLSLDSSLTTYPY